MDRGAAFFAGGLCGIIGLLSAISAPPPQSRQNESRAVAASIRSFLLGWVGEEGFAAIAASQENEILCLSTEVSLDMPVVAQELRDIGLIPVLDGECTSHVVEGDFGMFGALTYYFGPDGEEAGHLKISGLVCPSSLECLVGIETHASGDTYRMQRRGRRWVEIERLNRWVV